jgi:hypothetical protein
MRYKMQKSDLNNLSKTAIRSLFKKVDLNCLLGVETQLKDSIGFKKVYQKKHVVFYQLSNEGDLYVSKKTFIRFLQVVGIKQTVYPEKTVYLKINHYAENTLKVLSEMDALLIKNDELWVAIEGYAGAGKTTLSKQLSLIYDASVFHTDDFFKKPNIDPSVPFSSYGANIDYDKIHHHVIKVLSQKQTVLYEPFDFKTHQHQPPIKVIYKPIHIFEGAFVLHPSMKQTFDLKVFYDIPLFKQYHLIFRRSGFKRLWKFITTWIPNERNYVKGLEIKKQCHLIIK